MDGDGIGATIAKELRVETATILILAVVLLAAWIAANGRHLSRREQQSREWTADDDRPALWTSGAACVHCGTAGGLLELSGNDVHFTCLACGRSHVRETRA